MSQAENEKSRRDFMKGSGAAAGTMALASIFAGKMPVEAHEVNGLNPTPETLQQLLNLDHDGPVVMVNLLKFKPNGGEAEYAKYIHGAESLLEEMNMRVLFFGFGLMTLIGDAYWDAIALAEYPDKAGLMRLATHPKMREFGHHRAAGLESQINFVVYQTEGLDRSK